MVYAGRQRRNAARLRCRVGRGGVRLHTGSSVPAICITSADPLVHASLLRRRHAHGRRRLLFRRLAHDLVGGLNKGGKSIYALDVTDPSRFSEANADDIFRWEYTDSEPGYTYSRPAIVRMHNGQWAAVFGNGYNNGGDGHAFLYVVDIETGEEIAKIDTGAGSTGREWPFDTGRCRPEWRFDRRLRVCGRSARQHVEVRRHAIRRLHWKLRTPSSVTSGPLFTAQSIPWGAAAHHVQAGSRPRPAWRRHGGLLRYRPLSGACRQVADADPDLLWHP